MIDIKVLGQKAEITCEGNYLDIASELILAVTAIIENVNKTEEDKKFMTMAIVKGIEYAMGYDE